MNMITKSFKDPGLMSWHTDFIILLSRGASIAEACSVLGISRSTYYRHHKKDPFFAQQVERVRILISVELFNIVKKSEDWRASAWILERRFPRQFGTARERLRINGCTCGVASRVIR